MQPQFDSGLSLKRENVMKEKKVGDKVIFNYDVYDIVYNVEYEYDHTDILSGVVEKVIPGDGTKYDVRVIGVVNAENPRDYDNMAYGKSVITVKDSDVYRGTALFNLLHPELKLPTKEQIELIQSFYRHKDGLQYPASYIIDNWYKTVLGDMYNEDEFNI